jgi:oligopeptide/dipeptide ABC transporter ATP-binding protein
MYTNGDQIAEAPAVHEGLSRSGAWRRAVELLRAVRIADPELRAREYPHQISGGMRQRVAGAIALSCNPDLLIADEPTTALDPTVQAQYLDLLKALQAERGFGLVLISHDLNVIRRTCDRLAVMYAGRIVEHGATREVLARPAHPYTQALVGALPAPGKRAGALPVIDGQPPDLATLPTGCAFAPRCNRAADRCLASQPEPRMLVGERRVECFFPEAR